MPQNYRENDKVILDRLEKIQDDITSTKISLALNTKATTDIEDHLRTLNGKVITNQNSIQALQASDVLKTAFLKKIDDDKERNIKHRSGWQDWTIKGVIAIVVMLFYYLLTHNGFPHFLAK
jgi:DNA primase large subunit